MLTDNERPTEMPAQDGAATAHPADTKPPAAPDSPSGSRHGAVLDETGWRLDALLWVVMGLLVSFVLGLAGASLLKLKSDDLLAGMAITAICLHGATLVLVPAFLWVRHVSWSEAFGFGTPGSVRAVLLGTGATVLALPVAWTLGWFSAAVMTWVHVVPVAQKAITAVQESVSLGPQVFMACIAILLAPAAEELLFRGVLYPALRLPRVLTWSRLGFLARWLRLGPCRWLRWLGFARSAAWLRIGPGAWLSVPRPWLAAGISSIVFGAIHANTMTFLPLTFFGLVLTWLYERTGNLLTPIFSHSLFNLANFFLIVLGRPTS